MGVDWCYVHGADKESIDELEGKEVDRRFVHGRKRKDRRRANAGRQSLGSDRNTPPPTPPIMKESICNASFHGIGEIFWVIPSPS